MWDTSHEVILLFPVTLNRHKRVRFVWNGWSVHLSDCLPSPSMYQGVSH